jgi:hypothetical protein
MEKYARQHLAEGIRNIEDIVVDCDSEIFRALNSHYNRNNQLEVRAIIWQAYLEAFYFNFEFCLDSGEFLFCYTSDAEGVLQGYPRAKRPRPVLEESDLQDNRAHGRSNTRVFQVRAVDGIARDQHIKIAQFFLY